MYSVSCTTRQPRRGEIDGEDYHFLSVADFERLLAAGEFLEHATVHGNYYGTRRDLVLKSLEEGVDVMVDIDVQGARQIRGCDEAIRQSLADIFIMPPNFEELRHRLIRRGTETPEQIETRINFGLRLDRRRLDIVTRPAIDRITLPQADIERATNEALRCGGKARKLFDLTQ